MHQAQSRESTNHRAPVVISPWRQAQYSPRKIHDDSHELILPREDHLTVQFLLGFHYMDISAHVADLGAPVPTGMTESLSPFTPLLVFLELSVSTLRLLGMPALT